MSNATSFVVTAPLVVVKDETGRDLFLYEGQTVPANANTATVDRLTAVGLLTAKKSQRSTSSSPDED